MPLKMNEPKEVWFEMYRVRHHEAGTSATSKTSNTLNSMEEAEDYYNLVAKTFPMHWRCIERQHRIDHVTDHADGETKMEQGVIQWKIIVRSD